MATEHFDVLGMQEFGNTAVGYQALDGIVKAAPVRIVRVVTVNPGKLLLLFTGDVASVEAGLVAGRRVADTVLLDELFIPNVHRSVVEALHGGAKEITWDSIGIVDVSTITAGVDAADRAAKESEVRIVQIRFDDAMGGRSSVRFSGSLYEVEAAMAVVERFLSERDLLIRSVIIPNPHPDVLPSLNLQTEGHHER